MSLLLRLDLRNLPYEKRDCPVQSYLPKLCAYELGGDRSRTIGNASPKAAALILP